MEASFRHVEEEGVIGSKEKEHQQEAGGDGLSEGGYRGHKNQCGQNQYVGEGIQEDEWLKEA